MVAQVELEPKGVQQLEAPRPKAISSQPSSTKNRGRLDTLAEIVNACGGGANKSRVMLVANVNSVVATELLNKLVNSGLITCVKEDHAVTYRATPEGFGFMNKYSDLVSMLCAGSVPQTRLMESGRTPTWI